MKTRQEIGYKVVEILNQRGCEVWWGGGRITLKRGRRWWWFPAETCNWIIKK